MNDPFDNDFQKQENPYEPSYGESSVPADKALTATELAWGSGMHLSGLGAALLSSGMFGFLGPLVLWLIKRHDAEFLDDQGKEALNFHLSIALWDVISVAVGTLLFWLILPMVLFLVPLALLVVQVIFSIIAAIRANDGEYYRYPMTIRFVK